MKKRNCPKCGSNKVVPVVYGLPTEQTLDEAKKGDIVLGVEGELFAYATQDQEIFLLIAIEHWICGRRK